MLEPSSKKHISIFVMLVFRFAVGQSVIESLLTSVEVKSVLE
jgi:hypothetical protein